MVKSISEMAGNWQQSMLTVKERTTHLLETGIFSDVTFLVGSGDNIQSISAHKLILSMGSPVFADVFSDEETKFITVPHISPQIFSKMLRYLYTDYLSLGENTDEVFDLCYAAKKYKISKLENDCSVYLKSLPLQPDTVCRILEAAKILGIESLQDRCMTLISTSTSDVLSSAEFLSAKQETVQMILQIEETSAESELEFFSALLAWSRAENRRKNLDESPANIKPILYPLLTNIRFLAMTIDEFTKAINDAEDIIDSMETIEIYMKIANLRVKRFKRLPGWCNIAGSRRMLTRDIVLETNFESFYISYDTIYSMGFITQESYISSTLDLVTSSSNIVIKGVKIQCLELLGQRDGSICNESRIQVRYLLSAFNGDTLMNRINSSLIIGEEIKVIFPNCIPVALGEKATITVAVINTFTSNGKHIKGERKTEDFQLWIDCNHCNRKCFSIKEVIYFFN